jgi:lysyl-tRNA synthetase class I
MSESESQPYRYKLPRRMYQVISKRKRESGKTTNEELFEGDALKPVREAIDKIIQAARRWARKGKTPALRSEVDKAQQELENWFNANNKMLDDRQQRVVSHYIKLQEGTRKSPAAPPESSAVQPHAPFRPYLTPVYP